MTAAERVLVAVLAGAAVLVLVGLPLPARPLTGLSPLRAAPRWTGPRSALAATALALLAAGGPIAAGLGLLGGVGLLRAVTRRAAATQRREERAGAAEALAVLSSELRAGRPPGAALDAAASVATGPMAHALAAAAGAGTLGADPALALLRSAPSSAVPEVLRGLAACWQVCASTGSSLATAVERLAGSLRAEQAQRLAVESELAGPRATALMLALLPVAGVALAAGLGARPLHVLLHTPVGAACLGAGLLLEVVGMWWTQRLVAAAGGTR